VESDVACAETRLAARTATNRKVIGLYVVAVFFYWIGLYLYMPTLSTYATSRTESLTLVGTALSMYGFWQMLVRLPIGILSDWLGRRKVFIVVGFALVGLGAYVMGAIDSIWGIIVGRSIVGIAAGTWVILVVAFGSLFPPEEAVRASTLLTFVGSVGRVLATGITGTLNRWGMRFFGGSPEGVVDEFAGYPLAYYLAALAAVLAVLAILPGREVRRPRKRPSWSSLRHLVTRRDVLLPSLLSAVAQYGNWAATFGFFPILASNMGASDVTVSLMLSANLVVYTLSNLGATALVNRVGARRLVYIGFGLLAVGLAGGGLAPSVPVLFAAQLCIGLSQGVDYPVLMGLSIQNVDEQQRSTAMGLHQAVYALGMFGGPWLGGILSDAVGIRGMFGGTAVVILALGWLGASRLSRPAQRPA